MTEISFLLYLQLDSKSADAWARARARARARVFLDVLNIGKASGFSLLADPTPLVAAALSTASAA